ncbi:MAG: hypothetical protein AAF471_07045 [Myxococcota bacterium]
MLCKPNTPRGQQASAKRPRKPVEKADKGARKSMLARFRDSLRENHLPAWSPAR